MVCERATAADFDERSRLNRDCHLNLARATRKPIVAITMKGAMAVLVQFIAQIGPGSTPDGNVGYRIIEAIIRALLEVTPGRLSWC